jgi:hypothetical protein
MARLKQYSAMAVGHFKICSVESRKGGLSAFLGFFMLEGVCCVDGVDWFNVDRLSAQSDGIYKTMLKTTF